MNAKFDNAFLQGNREVTTQEARDFAAYHGIGFAETSAKTGQNVEEAFQMVTQQGRLNSVHLKQCHKYSRKSPTQKGTSCCSSRNDILKKKFGDFFSTVLMKIL